MDVQVAVGEFLASKFQLSPHSRRGYRLRLAVFTSWCESQHLALEELKTSHLRTFIEDVSRRPGQKGGTLRSSSVRLYVTTVKTFLAWCASEEDFEEFVSSKVVSRIPAIKAEQPIIETFTPEQIAALFAATGEQPFPIRDRAIVSVLLDTGIRASELVGLTIDCCWLDPDDSYLKILGKGKKWREVPLGRTARTALRRYITRYRKPRTASEQHVFLGRTGEPLMVSGLEQIIRPIGHRARIKGVRVSPHTFRHTFACMYLLNGGDIYRLARIMGHTSVKVTERYLSAIKSKQVRQENHSVLDHLKDL